VALARAIVREPSVFLMDEPLSNLDAKLRTSMRGEIKRLQKRLGTTTLYVTHDQAEAMTMADLVAVMREGELQQLAPPDEIYDRPANRFVAAFVGNPPMNVLEGGMDESGQSFRIGDQRLALGELSSACASAGATALGVRPEDLEILPQGTPGALAGEIYVVEPMGNETLVDVRIGDQRVMARAAREFAAPIGSPIGVRVALKSACFFGPEGTTALHRSDRASKRREMSA
jgi:multiple sugar transport system ATP-binding protein